MVQCVICEDWLHEEHISPETKEVDGSSKATTVKTAETEESAAPETKKEDTTATEKTATPTNGDEENTADDDNGVSPDQFDELICLECMQKHPFLLAYTVDTPAEETSGGNLATTESDPAAAKPAQVECVLKAKQKQLEAEGSTELRPTFWSSEWRNELCQCAACVALFEKHGIAFLLDNEDSLHVYEANAREKKVASDEELAQRAFASKLSHEQQVEVAMGYSLMKNNLQQYLAGFAAAGKTVKADDIKSFFEGLNQAKRQKTES